MDIATVQKVLDHADPRITARYDRRSEVTMREAVRALHVPYVPIRQHQAGSLVSRETCARIFQRPIEGSPMGGQKPLPLNENLLTAIGTFIATFSLLELEIHYLVWRLLSPSQQGIGRHVTSAIGFQELLRMLGSLFEYRTRDEDLLKRMRALSQDLNGAGRVRNDVLHSFWVNRPGLEEALVIRMQSRPEGFREELLNYDIDALYEEAEKFKSLQREVQELHYAIYRSSRSLQVE